MAISWTDLELRHLATFRTLARRKSFRATAAELGFAQSAISRHIATLEQRVGARLVDRGQGTGAASLTPAGELLLQHAEAILDRVAVAERDFAHHWGTAPARIRTGVFQSASSTLLAPALAETRAAETGVIVDLIETDKALTLLQSGDIDLAFTETQPAESDIEHVQLVEDPYVLVVPADDPRPPDTVVPLEWLRDAPLLMYRYSCHLAAAAAVLSDNGLDLRPVMHADDALTLQGLVAARVGFALLPRLAVATAAADIRLLAVDSRFPHRLICLAWNADRAPSGPMKTLISAIETVAGRLAIP